MDPLSVEDASSSFNELDSFKASRSAPAGTLADARGALRGHVACVVSTSTKVELHRAGHMLYDH